MPSWGVQLPEQLKYSNLNNIYLKDQPGCDCSCGCCLLPCKYTAFLNGSLAHCSISPTESCSSGLRWWNSTERRLWMLLHLPMCPGREH